MSETAQEEAAAVIEPSAVRLAPRAMRFCKSCWKPNPVRRTTCFSCGNEMPKRVIEIKAARATRGVYKHKFNVGPEAGLGGAVSFDVSKTEKVYAYIVQRSFKAPIRGQLAEFEAGSFIANAELGQMLIEQKCPVQKVNMTEIIRCPHCARSFSTRGIKG